MRRPRTHAAAAALAALLVALGTTPAWAAAPRRAVVVGLTGGGLFPVAPWGLYDGDAVPFGERAGPGAVVGLRLGGQILEWLAIVADLELVPYGSEESGTNLAIGTSLDLIGTITPAEFRLFDRPWHPYLLVGGGLFSNVDGALGRDTDGQVRVGAGLRGMLTDWLALRVELLDVVTDGAEGRDLGNLLLVTAGIDVYLATADPAPAPPPVTAPPVAPPPAPPDGDGDGVADADDACPDVAGRPAFGGCLPPPAPVTPPAPAPTPAPFPLVLQFALGTSALDDTARAALDEVAEYLRGHPEAGRVRIEGFTDDRGSARFNLRLSRARAEAARDHLVGAGVAPQRLDAVGLGEARLVLGPDGQPLREQCRRVELHRVEGP